MGIVVHTQEAEVHCGGWPRLEHKVEEIGGGAVRVSIGTDELRSDGAVGWWLHFEGATDVVGHTLAAVVTDINALDDGRVASHGD